MISLDVSQAAWLLEANQRVVIAVLIHRATDMRRTPVGIFVAVTNLPAFALLAI
jgi:hypothetical protein